MNFCFGLCGSDVGGRCCLTGDEGWQAASAVGRRATGSSKVFPMISSLFLAPLLSSFAPWLLFQHCHHPPGHCWCRPVPCASQRVTRRALGTRLCRSCPAPTRTTSRTCTRPAAARHRQPGQPPRRCQTASRRKNPARSGATACSLESLGLRVNQAFDSGKPSAFLCLMRSLEQFLNGEGLNQREERQRRYIPRRRAGGTA
eukprot:363711-Chlamydomonas_euryale.AAC.14